MKRNRRFFLKKGLIFTGGILMLPSYTVVSSPRRNATVLKMGVIGAGNRGKGLITSIEKIEGMEVVACADVLPFRLEEGLARAPVKAKGYHNHHALLNDKNVDAVIIATPFSTHGDIAIDALQAKKHVFCEKTMAKGIKSIQAVINSVKNSGMVFQTGHQYHNSALYIKACEIIAQGYIGEVTAVHCQWNRNGNWRRSVPSPEYERMVNWRMYREYSGGLVAELMSHQIDFVNWFSKSLPEKFTGFGGIDHWKDGRETMDNVHLLLQYPSGMDASFTCTTTNGYEGYQIKVLGKKATMILDYHHGIIYAENNTKKTIGTVDGVSGATIQAWKANKGVPINAEGKNPTRDALIQFRASVVDGAPVVSDITTGANTSKCVQIALDTLYESRIKYWKAYPELQF